MVLSSLNIFQVNVGNMVASITTVKTTKIMAFLNLVLPKEFAITSRLRQIRGRPGRVT